MLHYFLAPIGSVETVDTRPEEEMRVCTVASRRLLCLAALRLFNLENPIYETGYALVPQIAERGL
jgi:hypothetical protein